MMSKQLLISNLPLICGIFIVFSLLPLYGFCIENAEKINGPIVITSRTLTADDRNHTAVFENSVVAKTANMTIYADKMLVTYDKKTGNIISVDAEGKVKLIKGNRIITSDKATYQTDDREVFFTGEPKAIEDENIITGKNITYYLNEDRFFVEGSKVVIVKKKE
jgi:lipopolysaccharide export system protein LptA